MRRLARLLDRPYGSADNHRNMLQPRFMSIPLQLVRCHSARIRRGESFDDRTERIPAESNRGGLARSHGNSWLGALFGVFRFASAGRQSETLAGDAAYGATDVHLICRPSSLVPRPSWRIVVNFTICGQSASQSSRNAMTTEETATCWSQAAAHTQADDDGVAPVCAGGALAYPAVATRGVGRPGGCAGRLWSGNTGEADPAWSTPQQLRPNRRQRASAR
jgi:hypothetical protein